MSSYHFKPIAYVESPFKEKFGVPRQPGLAPAARGWIRFVPPYDDPESLKGLEYCSHLWIQFIFHQNMEAGWRAKVRPPRLGGNRRVGVFATRSSYRPNPLGLSVVRLESVSNMAGDVALRVSGLDLVDGTPVLDIKPYVPYVDSVADASNGIAPDAPEKMLQVVFSTEAQAGLELLDSSRELRELITEVLAYDPRPAYKGGQDSREYGMKLQRYDIRWRIGGADLVEVTGITPL